jgi:hypothetical protein
MFTRSLCLLLGSATLTAQQFSPFHFADAECASGSALPFGNPTVPIRYSQIHDAMLISVINGMSFRHDSATTVFPAHAVTIDAWVSNTTVPSSAMSTVFDNNHGNNKVQVITNRTFSLPPSDPADLPGQFVLDFPFDVPFNCTGGPLCWEVHVTAKTQTTSIVYDAVSAASAANPAMVMNRFGTGCRVTGQPIATMTANGTQSITWLGGFANVTVDGSGLQPNGLSLFCTSLDRSVFGGIPLPAVIPGSIGAPSGTCTIYSDIVTLATVANSATGTASNTITFWPSVWYHGLNLYSQIWALDPAANPFGLATSNAVTHQIVAPFASPMPVSSMWLSGSLGPTASSTAGLGSGLMTRFY